jgi:hypothetical protein
MTHELAQEFFHLDSERFHFKPFGSIESYLDFLGSIDVGIAPPASHAIQQRKV